MTDFFADLEREIRAAHPRRPKPSVPVRAIAVTAAMLVAVAVALGTLAPSGEREAAAPSPRPAQDRWTEYAPLDCGPGRVVDGRIPDEIVDRFAILRGDVEPFAVPENRIPPVIAEVVRQSARAVGGPQDSKFAFFVGRFYDEDCRAGAVAVCLISLDVGGVVCADPAERSVEGRLARDLDDGRRLVAVLAEDSVASVDGNVDVVIRDGAGCAGQPEMEPLQKRFAIFRGPPAKDVDGIEMALPRGYHSVYLGEARTAELVGGTRYAVVPVGDATCGTAVCLVRLSDEKAACAMPPTSAGHAVVVTLVTDLGDDRYGVAGIVTDGVKWISIEHAAGANTEALATEPQGTVFYAEVQTEDPKSIEVVPGS